jgi:glycine dehydrogenase
MVSDLTGMPLANASLLDEGTAAAEAMTMFFSQKNKRDISSPKFFVDSQVFEQTKAVIETRAEPIGIQVVFGEWKSSKLDDTFFGALIQYPNSEGKIEDYSEFTRYCKEKEIYTVVAADILSLTLLESPGSWGADAVVGNTQRFGVPMGFGGPHAAYFATHEQFKRQIPGRIIGVSIDSHGNQAYRMALQTREQHIKREKATSNICTAQALLAIMAGMYAVYHGPQGLISIAKNIHDKAVRLYEGLSRKGIQIKHRNFFDTIRIDLPQDQIDTIRKGALELGFNFYYSKNGVQISLDETTTDSDLEVLQNCFSSVGEKIKIAAGIPKSMIRGNSILEHPVFNMHHTETKLMRYCKRLENRDLSLMHAMIPLGSCTMKLNAASLLFPVSYSNFSNIHPFAPADQHIGYSKVINDLEKYLCEITGFTACSLQPNSGAQGEYSGLLLIRAYHKQNGQDSRNIALIPSSAHGTNPASAVMAGMEVLVVKCDEKGNIDINDLREKAIKHKEQLSALMVTYPSTHGVFEKGIREICKVIHDNGGLVYMDGANMNAQVGFTSPAMIGADVCHLNLHKTFSIPHGGGGPGVGPICVNDKLAPFLPGHSLAHTGGEMAIPAVSSAPWGSASILLISYGYIRMLGAKGMTDATRYAILSANYIKARLSKDYHVLYTGENGRCAHELILDLRPFKNAGISAEDVAKRLIDYGFHAPTLSFPVPGTVMIEPTESEDKTEIDRFCEAMLGIKNEIDEIARGEYDQDNNVLTNAPHTITLAVADEWPYKYSREKAVYPKAGLKEGSKFWVSVGRLDNAYGDRNLVCTCPPLESYEA